MTHATAADSAIDAIVIGGGIAGLSVVAALAGERSVLLLEREALLCSHASGHNAAIYRPLEDDSTSAWLAQRSLALLSQLLSVPVLARTGVLLVSSDSERTQKLAVRAQQQQVAHRLLDRSELQALEPSLAGGQAQSALWLTDGGVLDIHALSSGLAKVARERGAQLRTGVAVSRIETASGRVCGVTLADGTRIDAKQVVLCAGAWAAELGQRCGSQLQLTPVRRHLVQLRPGRPIAPGAPVVWRLEDELYYRPESGGLLASPCDETPWPAQSPPADPAALLTLAAKLERLSPSLAGSAVQRSWACLRTFAADRELLAGPDPDLRGLHWLCGLGGRGMSVAVAAGELVASEMLKDSGHPLRAALSPGRPAVRMRQLNN